MNNTSVSLIDILRRHACEAHRFSRYDMVVSLPSLETVIRQHESQQPIQNTEVCKHPAWESIQTETLIEEMEKGIWHQAQDNEFDTGFNAAKRMAIAVVRTHLLTQQRGEMTLLSTCCEKDVTGQRYCPKCGWECHVKEAPKREVGNQEFLRHLVDVVWNCATESEEVPATFVANDLIAKAKETFDNRGGK